MNMPSFDSLVSDELSSTHTHSLGFIIEQEPKPSLTQRFLAKLLPRSSSQHDDPAETYRLQVRAIERILVKQRRVSWTDLPPMVMTFTASADDVI